MEAGQHLPTIRVLIADDIVKAAETVQSMLETQDYVAVCGVARTAAELFSEVRALHPDVIVMKEYFSGVSGFALAEELHSIAPSTKIALLAAPDSTEGQARAAHSQVSAYLSTEVTTADLINAILNVTRGGKVIGRSPIVPALPGYSLIDIEPVTAPTIETRDEPIHPIEVPTRRKSDQNGELIVLLSGKGGVGKSLLAANLSIALSMDKKTRVALIDLDLQFGDIAVILGVKHTHSIEELASRGENIDNDLLNDVLAKGPEDLRILIAPSSPELADLVTASTIRTVVQELRKSYDYIIIDTASHLEERTLEMIEIADRIIVVASFNVTTVKDTKITLRLLNSLGVAKEKIAVVLNQHRQKVNFTREQIEETLRFRVLTHLPFEPTVVDESIDNGLPFVLSEPRSGIAQQIQVLVKYLNGTAVTPSNSPINDKVSKRRFTFKR